MTSIILKNERKTALKTCSACGSHEIAKSRLRAMEPIFVGLSGYRPYRCISCYKRNWIKKSRIQTILFWLLLVLIAANISYLLIVANQPTDDFAVNQIESSALMQTDETVYRAQMLDFDNSVLIPIDSDHRGDHQDLLESQSKYKSDKGFISTAADPSYQLSVNSMVRSERERARQSATVEQRSTTNKNAFLYRESVKREIANTIKVWRDSWQSGNISKYLECYSQAFSPEGELSRDQWKENRINALNRRTPKKIAISDSKLTALSGDSAELVFIQQYQSEGYSDTVLKKLSLAKNDGGWKLIREQVLSTIN